MTTGLAGGRFFAILPAYQVNISAMWLNSLRFLSLLFTALALGAGLAHLFELNNKLKLSHNEYLIVQQIYRGWALLGIVVAGSLLSTLALTIMAYRQKKGFGLICSALLFIIGTQVIFWVFTYPVNQQTKNWTILPVNWFELRKQWEFSHAAGALFNLIAFILLVLASLQKK